MTLVQAQLVCPPTAGRGGIISEHWISLAGPADDHWDHFASLSAGAPARRATAARLRPERPAAGPPAGRADGHDSSKSLRLACHRRRNGHG